MSTNKAIISIAVGIASIVFGLTVKQFHSGSILGGPTAGQGRPIARWKGRLAFVGIGLVFCIVGMACFFAAR